MQIPVPWILLFVRLVLAAVMLHYGWQKIRDPEANRRDFVQMGFKPGIFWGTLITVVEFFGGLAVLFGFYAELAATLFGFQMMVGAFWKLKIHKPFSDYSYDLQLLGLCVVLMSQGAGVLTLKSFPGSIFLRWDVVAVSLVAALLFAASSKPQLKTSQQTAS